MNKLILFLLKIMNCCNNKENLKQTYCILFEIPQDLNTEIFSEWISKNDIGKLDIAVSKTNLRCLWLEQLQRKIMQMKLCCSFQMKYLNWLFSRNICLNRLVIWEEHFDSDDQLKFNIRLNQINSLTISLRSAHGIAQVINECSSLKSLRLNRGSIDLLNVTPSILSQLQELSCTVSCEAQIDNILTHCKNLTKVSIPFIMSIDSIVNLLSSNINLTDIEIIDGPNVIETIFNNCCKLTSLWIINYCEDAKYFATLFEKYKEYWMNLDRYTFKNSNVSVTSTKSYIRKDKFELTLIVDNLSEDCREFLNNTVHCIRLFAIDEKLARCHYIFAFECVDSIFIEYARNISFKGYVAVLKCSNLVNLSIIDCTIDNELFMKAVDFCETINLKILKIDPANSFPIEDVTKILNKMSRLTTLFINGVVDDYCDSVKIKGLTEHLKNLYLKGRNINIVLKSELKCLLRWKDRQV